MKNTVPALLHMIWLGSDPPPLKTMRSWPLLHPMFRFIVWTDDKVRRVELYNRKIYDWLKSPTMKADLLRYEILYQMGGIYVDVDFYCLRSITHLLQYPFFAAQDNYWWPIRGYIANGFMGCTPHHPLAAALVHNFASIPLKSKTGHGALKTGPRYLSEMWKAGQYKVEVLPRELYTFESDTADRDKAFTMHINKSHDINQTFYEEL